MKIVILNTTDKNGGAAIAAGRLMKALNKSGIEAQMLVRNKLSENPDVFSPDYFAAKNKALSFFRFVWERLVIFLCNGFNKKNVFRVSIANTGIDISNHRLVREADIIHLHWINQGFLSLKGLEKLLSLNKPVVWTMHDMWACTGICHYSGECNHFQEQCGKCFYLDSTSTGDLSHRIFEKKREIYTGHPIHFVCCSHWIKGKLLQGQLTKKFPVISIPNPIDTSIYKKTDKKDLRETFNLPEEKLLILFGALNVNDERKGISFLIESLIYLQKEYPEVHEKIELVVFGQVKSEIDYFNVPLRSIGFLSDEERIVELYNAVDIFVTTSLEDNLPNTIMEAMACGTPCVGFETGGIPEMIDHKVNGYVAKYKSIEDMAQGICWCLDESHYESLSQNCIEKVTAHYAEPIVAQQYGQVYKQMEQCRK